MAKNTNKVLTIDITNESITIIEVTPALKKQTTVHNAVIFETPEDAYEDGQIKDKDKIAMAIKEQLNQNGITNKNAIFVLTSTKVVNREVLIPAVAEGKIKGVVNANASEYFPVDIEDYVVSHSVLETVIGEDKSKQFKLLVVAAPIAMVKSYYDLASMIGLNVQSMDYVGNAMLQLIKTQTSANATTMVIQLGSESTVLNIVKGDTLLLQRTVPYGTNSVVTEVMDEKGVDATTAMALLQNERLITVDFDDNAATGAFRYLINNIGRVMDYFATKNPDKPIDDVFLTGDGALIRGIDGLFKIQLNISTRIMDSLYNVKFDPRINMKLYNPVYLIVPIGAAFDPMGFVPTEVKSRGGSGGAYLQGSLVFFILAILVSAGYSGWQYVARKNAIEEKDLLNSKIAQIQDIEQIINEYERIKATYEDAKIMYDQTYSLNENVRLFFEELEKNTPKNIFITNLGSAPDGVRFAAVSTDYDSIAKFIIQLKQIACIDNAFITEIIEDLNEQTATSVYNFNVTCNYVSMQVEEDEVVEEDSVGLQESAE